MSKSKESKEKDAKGKVPNAFEINPGMMDALAQITPANLPQLLLANP